MKRTIVTLLIMIAAGGAIRSLAQGIDFTQGLQWREVIAKAKAQNKFIFIDCYATWCGPCKQMDQEVFTSPGVGDVYNKQFICIRLQMDKTNHDNDTVKKLYRLAEVFGKNYAVNAYPTFLFFDKNGDPVHKVVGFRDAKGFIQLAADVQNPEKQYYHVLKNFEPGKLDTADEKGLIYSMKNTDPKLAARIGEDYFSRIPRSRLQSSDNYQLLLQLSDDPQIANLIVQHIAKLTAKKSLNALSVEFITNPRIKDRPEIQQLVLAYLEKLNDQQLCLPENIDLLINDRTDSKKQVNEKVAAIARRYMQGLKQDGFYDKTNIPLIAAFMVNPADPGFKQFYAHAEQIDRVMHSKGYAEDCIEHVISRAELDPAFAIARQKDAEPDFAGVKAVIEQKYNSYYADHVIANGRVYWYLNLVVRQKKDQYWPPFNSARITQFELIRPDTVKVQSMFVNNVCYVELFGHCDNQQELEQAVTFMKNVVAMNSESAIIIDTYASLLYKAGKRQEAIEEEKKALAISARNKYENDVKLYSYTIEQMQQNKKIWEDKKITGFD